MAALGPFALFVAALAAGWLLFGAAGSGGDARTVTLLKAAAWFGLAGALFAAKLFPLALMILLAAGGVTAIEVWRERTVKDDDTLGQSSPSPARPGKLTREEAASVLGVPETASAEEIKSAHRRLIAQLHPDRGGSDYLAAKINDARARLLEDALPPSKGDA